jgi:hypothetical protein
MKQELIHDWNDYTGPKIPPDRRVMLDDETLRDGHQNRSVRDPYGWRKNRNPSFDGDP